MVVYLVRSSRTYARNRSLTTGTFNLVVKDRIAFRLSGAPSGLDGLAARANPAVLETHQPYSRRKTLSIRASHSISTRFPHWERRVGGAAQESGTSGAKARMFLAALAARLEVVPFPVRACYSARNSMVFRLGLQKRLYFGACRSGRQKIEKRSYVWRSLL